MPLFNLLSFNPSHPSSCKIFICNGFLITLGDMGKWNIGLALLTLLQEYRELFLVKFYFSSKLPY